MALTLVAVALAFIAMPFAVVTLPIAVVAMTIAVVAVVSVVPMILVESVRMPRRPFSLLNDHRPLLFIVRTPYPEFKSIRRDVHLWPSAIHAIELPMPQRRLALQIVLVPQRSLMLLVQRIDLRCDRPNRDPALSAVIAHANPCIRRLRLIVVVWNTRI